MAFTSSGIERRLLLVAVSTVALNACGDSVGPKARQQPNIILIVTDDQAAGDELHMPTLQRLARERGVTFSRAFVTTPLCGPTRASILRGQYVHNHRITANRLPMGGFVPFRTLGLERSTVSTELDDAGYRTAFFGKYINDYGTENHSDWEYVPPGWDEWYGMVGWGRGSPIDYLLNESGSLVRYAGEKNYKTDVLARKAVDFIERSIDDGEPFFAMISPSAPHLPARPAERHAGMFAGAAAPRSPSFNEEDLSDKPFEHYSRPPLSDAEIFTIDFSYGRRLESLQAVDDLVGALWDVLVARGEHDRTFILFTSDNGFHFGAHRAMLGKNQPFEEDLLVPLVVVRPVPGGFTNNDIVLSIDLAPMILSLAGLPTPAFMDGRSFGRIGWGLRGPGRRAFLAEKWSATSTVPTWQVLRTETHLYTEWDDGARELYDLRTDPYQLENLVATTDSSVLAAYGVHLRKLSRCAGSRCGALEGRQVPSQ